MPARANTAAGDERWVEPRVRDAELEPLLDAAIRKPSDAALGALLRFGATVDYDRADAVTSLEPYIRGEQPSRPGLALIRPPRKLNAFELESPLESLEPGEDWPERLKAKLWYALARNYADRYSDYLLNLTATALANAAPWYEKQQPLIAAAQHAWRARVLGYASYGADDILPAVDRAMELIATISEPAADVYIVIVQLCEAIMRVRVGLPGHSLRSPELLAFGVRGLEMAKTMKNAPQVSELYGAVAEAAIHNGGELDLMPLARVLTESSVDPLVLAELAWRRALELETGMFYGEHRPDHEVSHRRSYKRGLGIIALRRGDLAGALELLGERDEQTMLYERLNLTKDVMRVLAAYEVEPVARATALVTRLREDLMRDTPLQDWERDIAGKYVSSAVYRTWNAGLRDATRAIIDEVRAKHGLTAHPRTQPAGTLVDDEAGAEPADGAESSLAQLLAKYNIDLSSEAAGDDMDEVVEQAPPETDEERLARILAETIETWSRDTRTLLVFSTGAYVESPGVGGARVIVNAPEFALGTVLGDSVLASALTELESRLRAVAPEVVFKRRIEALPVDSGDPPDTSLAFALSVAGATEALSALGLTPFDGPIPLDDPRIEGELEWQRSRRARLMWEA